MCLAAGFALRKSHQKTKKTAEGCWHAAGCIRIEEWTEVKVEPIEDEAAAIR